MADRQASDPEIHSAPPQTDGPARAEPTQPLAPTDLGKTAGQLAHPPTTPTERCALKVILGVALTIGLALMGILFAAGSNEFYKQQAGQLAGTITALWSSRPAMTVEVLLTVEVPSTVIVVIEVPVTVTPIPPRDPRPGALRMVEIMHVPMSLSGLDRQEPWNEYVEIRNCTADSVSIETLWIGDGDRESAQPDKLITWGERFPTTSLGDGIITNSSVIPSGETALVLTPGYLRGGAIYSPLLQEGTIVLTIDGSSIEGDFIGDPAGIEGATHPSLDVLILYAGTANKVRTVIDSYAMPDISPPFDPFELKPLAPDLLPLAVVEEGLSYGGVQRKKPCDPDIAGNWETFDWSERSPGY